MRFANGVARAEVFAFATHEQLLDEIGRVLRELQRVVVAWQQRCLVEAKRVLQVGAPREHLDRALDEFAQDQACGQHHLGAIDGRVQLDAADAQPVEKRVEKVLGRYVDALAFGRGVIGGQFDEFVLEFGFFALRFLLRFLAEQHGLEFVVARNFLFVEELHAGLEHFLVHELLEVAGRDRGFLGLQRHGQALALVDMNLEFEVAHAHAIAVEQAARVALADRFAFVVHVHAVAAHVGEVIHAAAVVDRGMAARDVAVRVGQDPVVLQRTTDCAALLVELAHVVVAHKIAVFGDDFDLQRHGSPRGFVLILRQIKHLD